LFPLEPILDRSNELPTAFEGGNKLPVKQTAVTNTVEPQFGFCEEDQVEREAGVDRSKFMIKTLLRKKVVHLSQKMPRRRHRLNKTR
jgi:hypothetical protein